MTHYAMLTLEFFVAWAALRPPRFPLVLEVNALPYILYDESWEIAVVYATAHICTMYTLRTCKNKQLIE